MDCVLCSDTDNLLEREDEMMNDIENKSYVLIAPCGCIHAATTASRPESVKRFFREIINDTAIEEGYIVNLVDTLTVSAKFGHCDRCKE